MENHCPTATQQQLPWRSVFLKPNGLIAEFTFQHQTPSVQHKANNDILPLKVFESVTLALSRSELVPFPYLLVGEEQLQEGLLLLEEVRKLWLLGCRCVGLLIRDVRQSHALGGWPEKHPLNSTDLSL